MKKTTPDKSGTALFGGLASAMTLFDFYLAFAPPAPEWFRCPARKPRPDEDPDIYARSTAEVRFTAWREVFARRMVDVSKMGKDHIVRDFNRSDWEKLAEFGRKFEAMAASPNTVNKVWRVTTDIDIPLPKGLAKKSAAKKPKKK